MDPYGRQPSHETIELSNPNYIRTNNPDAKHKTLYVSRNAGVSFDGTRMRKAIQRKIVDFVGTEAKYVENRLYRLKRRDKTLMQPDSNYATSLFTAHESLDNPAAFAATKYVHASVNKENCPIFVLKWMPGGKRLVTGTYKGEFTVWNGLNFNFETILQAHNDSIRGMVWSHNQNFMLTSDSKGIVKYWQANMNNLKTVRAHNEIIRDLTFAPFDNKFATACDDRTVKIFDFQTGREERELSGEHGHGWDIKSIDWHPHCSMLASGSKDKSIKLWDPSSGKLLTTLHGHKNAVIKLKFNKNGYWFMSASRDQLLKLYDIRMMREIFTFKGHESDVCSATWHPTNPNLLTSGDKNGDIQFWSTSRETPIASINKAHDSNIWSLDWHPLGHILTSGSNDYTTKFWTRNYPGDEFKDKFNFVAKKEPLQLAGIPPTHGAAAGLNPQEAHLGSSVGAGLTTSGTNFPSANRRLLQNTISGLMAPTVDAPQISGHLPPPPPPPPPPSHPLDTRPNAFPAPIGLMMPQMGPPPMAATGGGFAPPPPLLFPPISQAPASHMNQTHPSPNRNNYYAPPKHPFPPGYQDRRRR